MKQWELHGVTPAGPPWDDPEPRARGDMWGADLAIRALVDQLPAVFWTTDADLMFTSMVGAGLGSLGLGPNQVVGMAVGDVFEAGSDSPLLDAHRQALEGRSVRFDMTWSGRPYSCGAAPLRDSNGDAIGVICAAIDAAPLSQPEHVAGVVSGPMAMPAGR